MKTLTIACLIVAFAAASLVSVAADRNTIKKVALGVVIGLVIADRHHQPAPCTPPVPYDYGYDRDYYRGYGGYEPMTAGPRVSYPCVVEWRDGGYIVNRRYPIGTRLHALADDWVTDPINGAPLYHRVAATLLVERVGACTSWCRCISGTGANRGYAVVVDP